MAVSFGWFCSTWSMSVQYNPRNHPMAPEQEKQSNQTDQTSFSTFSQKPTVTYTSSKSHSKKISFVTETFQIRHLKVASFPLLIPLGTVGSQTESFLLPILLKTSF